MTIGKQTKTVFRIYDPNERHSDLQEIHTEMIHCPAASREISNMEQHHVAKSHGEVVTITQV
jgi:hypothetical protein